MVQTIGIALGNINCYVAACKDGGIEILLNDYSQRSTPAMVAFGENCRLIGVDASQNQMMNFKNTIFNIMQIIGRPFKELVDLELPFKLEESADGQACVVVTHMREEKRFSIVQVLAMLFTKLKDLAGATDCVINCPQYFNEAQYIAVYQAALIAGLNPLQFISDMSAIALYYGYYRTNREDKDDKIMTFVNFGQSCLQTMVVLMSPKDDIIKVLATECEPEVGGHGFDVLLAEHFIKSQNLKLTLKSQLKLITECEKLKKQLSANSNEIPISIECLVSEEKDFNARIDRTSFEQLAEPLLKKIGDCLRRTLEHAKDCVGVEIAGGASRMPAFKRIVKDVFGMEASTTLNTDEAVARGCVLHCATLHPGVKVKREIKIEELKPINIDPKSVEVDPKLREIELNLGHSDRQWKARIDARNSLEEFIFDCKSKNQLLEEVDRCEEWLYEDGDKSSEEDFVVKLKQLRALLVAGENKSSEASEPVVSVENNSSEPIVQVENKSEPIEADEETKAST